MSSASVRTVVPLALVTGTSMLAMDFYLPAVPALQKSFGVDVTLAQATVAVFLAGLAASQFLWAEAFNRLGPRRIVTLGVTGLIAASVAGALAPSIGFLIAARLVQGIAAGAALVAAPSVVRASLSDIEAVRGIAAISMVESIIPAAGPVLGAALLTHLDWRGIFWVLSGLTLIALPFAIRATPRVLPGLEHTVEAGYPSILANRRYTCIALAHALCVGALLTFVASGPQLVIHALGRSVSGFAMLQVIGVAAFILTASQSGRISAWLGSPRAIQVGAIAQVLLVLILLTLAIVGIASFAAVAVFWALFCAALAVRGPPAFSEALSLPPAQMGRASAMLMLSVLAAAAAGTQLVAPFMAGRSMVPLLLAMLVFLTFSLMLVAPYPKGRSGRAVLADDGGEDQQKREQAHGVDRRAAFVGPLDQ